MSKIINQFIPVITCHDNAPIYLTDRWGEWIHDRGEVGADEYLSNLLHCKFNGADTKAPGDPRYFMGENEISHVAYMTGRVGILTEIEQKYCVDFSIKTQMEDPVSVKTFLPPSIFSMMVVENQFALSTIQQKYQESTLFVMYGEASCDDRLCICAFTPLSGQEDMFYGSPYSSVHEIKQLDRVLLEQFG